MIVNKQKEIEFINDCGIIVDYSILAKAIYWYSSKPTTRIKHIYLHGKYPAVSIYKEKIHIHRLIGMYINKRKLKRDEYIHHKDENRLNSEISNLVLMKNIEHQSLHNKGKLVGEKQREGIIKFNKTRKNIRQKLHRPNITYKKVNELLNKGYSINKIANKLGVDWSTIKARINDINNNPELLRANNS
jgi:hypothetical protein